MISVAPVSDNTKSLYQNITSPKPKQNAVIQKTQNNDAFDKQMQTENKSFLQKVKDYLFTPIDNPNYHKDTHGQKSTTNRLKQYVGYAFNALMYAFMFFYMYKVLARSGVKVKPESVNSVMNKYSEDLSNTPKLSDLALPEKLKDAINRMMNRIQDPKTFIEKGGVANNHILLYGPPGTGKTTVAKAIAKGIDNAELFSVDLSTIQGKFVGESEGNLKIIIENICKYAKNNPNKKIVVLMDEFDSVAIKDNGSSNQQYHASLLNVLKRAMSEKLAQHDNIILVATTNAELEKAHGQEWTQILDAAIADRFGEQIRVDNPTKEQFAEAIVNHYKKAPRVEDVLKHSTNEQVVQIAEKLENNKCSFRTLNRLFKNAAEKDGEKLTAKDVLSALDALIKSSKKEASQNFHIAGFAG